MADEIDQMQKINGVNGSLESGLPDIPDHGRKPWVRCLMQVLWPAFLGAAITVGLVFSMIDPMQVEWVHIYLNESREAAYTASFILFWIVYAFACSMTWFLATTETPSGRAGSQHRS